jgi:hypothetical protein
MYSMLLVEPESNPQYYYYYFFLFFDELDSIRDRPKNRYVGSYLLREGYVWIVLNK